MYSSSLVIVCYSSYLSYISRNFLVYMISIYIFYISMLQLKKKLKLEQGEEKIVLVYTL